MKIKLLFRRTSWNKTEMLKNTTIYISISILNLFLYFNILCVIYSLIVFSMFNELRWVMIVHFVDIGVIDDLIAVHTFFSESDNNNHNFVVLEITINVEICFYLFYLFCSCIKILLQ